MGLSGLCDLYLRSETNFPRLRFLSIFDSSFEWRDDFLYRGYLGVSVRRVKLVSVVAGLRKAGIICFSVPVECREGRSIGDAAALGIANEHASRNNCTLLAEADGEAEASPLYYLFRQSSAVGGEEKAGGAILVDRLDGHVWSYEEYEEYMYDYNNVM